MLGMLTAEPHGNPQLLHPSLLHPTPRCAGGDGVEEGSTCCAMTPSLLSVPHCCPCSLPASVHQEEQKLRMVAGGNVV